MRFFAAVALLGSLAAPLDGLAAALEAYGRLPALEDVRISPDGKQIAMIATESEIRKLVLTAIDGNSKALKLDAGALKLRDLDWAGPNHLIITASFAGSLGPNLIVRRGEWRHAVDFDLVHRTLRPIAWTPPVDVVYGPVMSRTIGGRPFVFVGGLTEVSEQIWPALLKVDLDAGQTSTAEWTKEDEAEYAVDGNGAVVAASWTDYAKQVWGLNVAGQTGAAPTLTDVPSGRHTLLGLGRDSHSLALEVDSDGGSVIGELPLVGGKWRVIATVNDTVQLFSDAGDGHLAGYGDLEGDSYVYKFFDPADQKAWETVVAMFADDTLQLASMTDDRRHFVVLDEKSGEPPAYWLADATKGARTLIGPEYAGLDAADIGRRQAVAFKAADGLALTGYLTLPPARRATNLPLVVFPHGGPASRDTPDFDWWAQAMASRGYAVLQVNFRGSAGLSPALLAAGEGQMGRKMQSDLVDGVRYLAGLGDIDPSRVCIVGASYGGYAALAGATLSHGVYRCAAAVAGVSDIARQIDWNKAGERKGARLQADRYWQGYAGDLSKLADISPAAHADQADIPILLVHGKDDTVVPYKQSQLMAAALAKAGKPCEFVALPSEDHWLSRGPTRVEMLKAVVAFLEKNNPPDAAASVTAPH